MEAIIIIVVIVVVAVVAIGLLFSGPRGVDAKRSEERTQRREEDDIVPLIGLGILDTDLGEDDPLTDGDHNYSELPDGWDYEDERLDE